MPPDNEPKGEEPADGNKGTSFYRESMVAGRVTSVLTALAAFLGLVYLVGAGVLWIRLAREGLPTEAVITSLPRELLLSIGLRSIFLPALVFAGLGALVLVVVEKRTATTEEGFWAKLGADFGKFVLLFRVLVASFAVLISVGVIIAVLWILGFGVVSALGWVLGGLAVIPLSAGIALGWGFLGDAPVASRIIPIALLAALVATFVRLSVEVANPQFEQVSVCAQNPDGVFQGLFIGETGNGVYLGDLDRESVVEIPRDRLKTVWFGLKLNRCPPR
jgi:hypothetical protein